MRELQFVWIVCVLAGCGKTVHFDNNRYEMEHALLGKSSNDKELYERARHTWTSFSKIPEFEGLNDGPVARARDNLKNDWAGVDAAARAAATPPFDAAGRLKVTQAERDEFLRAATSLETSAGYMLRALKDCCSVKP